MSVHKYIVHMHNIRETRQRPIYYQGTTHIYTHTAYTKWVVAGICNEVEHLYNWTNEWVWANTWLERQTRRSIALSSSVLPFSLSFPPVLFLPRVQHKWPLSSAMRTVFTPVGPVFRRRTRPTSRRRRGREEESRSRKGCNHFIQGVTEIVDVSFLCIIT